MPEGGTFADLWLRADVLLLAAGIYMERYRIGLFSALAELDDEAGRRQIGRAPLAREIVGRLDRGER